MYFQRGSSVSILCLIAVIASAFAAENTTTHRTIIIRAKEKTVTILPPRSTRTELKVSRSLDPTKTQTLNVKTTSGRITQVIVKRRLPLDSQVNKQSHSEEPIGSTSATKIKNTTPHSVSSKVTNSASKNETTKHTTPITSDFISEDTNKQKSITAEYGNWSPVIYNEPRDYREYQRSYDQKTVRFDDNGEIHEANVFRIDPYNPVLKNDRNPVRIEVASTNVKSKEPDTLKVPDPVQVRSDRIFVKNIREKVKKSGRNFDVSETEDIPEIHGVRVPDDESDKQTWRNARVVNGKLLPYPDGYTPPKVVVDAEVYEDKFATSAEELSSHNGPFTKEDNFKSSPSGPYTKFDNFKHNLNGYYGGPYKVSDNPVFLFKNHQSFGPFTKADNSRVANSKLIEYIKQINDKEQKRDYFNTARTSRSEKDLFQRRMLQHPGEVSFPESKVFTTNTNKQNNFDENSRNPILQYAHPDLGVQPATHETPEKRNKKVVYYTDAPIEGNYPYYIEPMMPEGSEKHRAVTTYNKNYEMPSGYQYYSQGPYQMRHRYGYVKPAPEQTVWQMFTDSMRETLQTGARTIQQLANPLIEPIAKVTRPVLDPMMEAANKISHNLGFNSQKRYAEDKLGFFAAPAAAAGTGVLPALGLVASGAALGLGAAAMGNFFDGNVMRSNAENLDKEHKRSMNKYLAWDNNNHKINKRSLDRFQMNYQSLDEEEHSLFESSLMTLIQQTDWSDTQCAKKTFCKVISNGSSDSLFAMEKKMEMLLQKLHPATVDLVSGHLGDVMVASKLHNCEKFICNKAIS